MVSLKIGEFEGYDIEEFTEFLLAQEDDEFELLLSKEAVLFFSPHNELAWEFATAAYVGQRLSEISTKFSYSVAPLAEQGHFSFTFKTDKLDKLSNILELVSGGYGNSEISEPINLASEVFTFIETTKNLELACKDLLDIYHKYFTSEEEEHETEE